MTKTHPPTPSRRERQRIKDEARKYRRALRRAEAQKLRAAVHIMEAMQ
jgi:hypothetical protein